MNRRSFLLVTASAALCAHQGVDRTLRARQSGPAQEDEVALLRAFLKKPKDAQHKAVADLRHQIAGIPSPWLQRIAEFAAHATRLRQAKVSGLQQRPPHHEEPSPFAELWCPIRVEYLWGHRAVCAIEKRTPMHVGTGKDAVAIPLGSPAEDLATALHGLHPDLDLALAGALAELDVSTDADQFSLFLDAWRNGQESFYRALDRSAGTREAVFYFDAMLGDFQQRFAPKGAPGSEDLRSLKQLHDALHDAFLAYRQYRALREAAACSAVLPEAVRLPRSLERYDTSKSGYALRDDLLILAALDAHDPLPGLRMIHDTMAALPHPLWATHGAYDALPPLQKAFAERLRKTIAERQDGGSVSSDGLRDSEAAARREVARRIQELARAAAASG